MVLVLSEHPEPRCRDNDQQSEFDLHSQAKQKHSEISQNCSLPPESTIRFFISHNILSSNVIDQAQSKLFCLPPEVVNLIIEKIRIPSFQVSFALTCKSAAVATEQSRVLKQWRGFRDKESLFRLLERKFTTKPWMPSKLRLCRGCWKYVSNDPNVWTERMGSEFDGADLNWFDIFNFFTPDTWQHHRCPDCCMRNNACLMTELQYMNLQKHGIICDQVICPGIDKRMSKP